MSYHYQDADGWLHASPHVREDQPGDTPPACHSCRKADNCPTFLPVVEAYLDNLSAWRDGDGDPTPCDASEDEGALAKRIRVLGYQWRAAGRTKPPSQPRSRHCAAS